MVKQKNGFSNKKLITISALLLVTLLTIGKDNFKPSTTSEIIVTSTDSIIKLHIANSEQKISTKTDCSYYWYTSNKVYQNTGGYSGKLLTDKYQVFNKNGNLVTEGNFKKGRKNGTWKYWEDNGKLSKTEDWQKGKLNGKVYKYNLGKITKETHYRNNLKHGKEIVFLQDSTITYKYKKGIQVLPKPKKEKKKWTWFKKSIKKEEVKKVLSEPKEEKQAEKKKKQENTKEKIAKTKKTPVKEQKLRTQNNKWQQKSLEE